MKLELAELTNGKLKGTIDVTYRMSCKCGAQEMGFGGNGYSFGEAMKEAAKYTDSWEARRAESTDISLNKVAYSDIDVYTLENGKRTYHGYKTFGPESAALTKIHRDFDGKIVLDTHAHTQYVRVEDIADCVKDYSNWI